MKVTLITICFNSERTIARCVESVLSQTRLPDEYLFVDGGSTDGTLELLDERVKRLLAVGVSSRVLHQERHPGEAGIPSAWNQGLDAATGDVIALLNSDDWYENNALAYVMEQFEADRNMEILAGPVQMVTPTGEKERRLYPQCLWLSQILMPLKHPACFISRSLYARIGKYDTSFKISSDYEFVWRCRKALADIHFFETCLVNMEAGGLANANRAMARNETLRIARMYAPYSPLPWLAWLLRFLSGR